MTDKKDHARGYLAGYEEGLREAWDELVSLAMKGYGTREIQMLIKTKKMDIPDMVREKQRTIERELKISLKEEKKEEKIKSEITEGNTYLLKESANAEEFSVFNNITSRGYSGLCAHRINPRELENRCDGVYGLVWLTKSEISRSGNGSFCDTDFKCISPTNLDQLTTYVLRSLDNYPESVVMIGGLEYLLTHNEFSTVLRFIQTLKDRFIPTRSILLVLYDPDTLDDRNVNRLEKEIGNFL